ncbi:MAG: hypothetical protein K2N34_00820 [Lachnospiraceae bacterium]|nr:hypothetical protein [Lachnospiraceae bacterium]
MDDPYIKTAKRQGAEYLKRETVFSKEDTLEILTMIEKDAGMAHMWAQFRKKNYFVGA